MLVQVALSLNIYEHLTYEYPGKEAEIEPGTRVVVPVGKQISTGWIVETGSSFSSKTKPILGIISGPRRINDRFLDYAKRIALSYFCSLGVVLDYSLPSRQKSRPHLQVEIDGETKKVNRFTPTQLQRLASGQPLRFFYEIPGETKPIPDAGDHGCDGFSHTLLLGYDRLSEIQRFVSDRVKDGGCVLLAVPDHLTAEYYAQMISGGEIFDSSLKPRQREELWERAVHGELKLVIGGMLAALLPLPNLRGIISDRSGSLLHGGHRSLPGFHVHHLAVSRAQAYEIPFLEGAPAHTVSSYAHREDLMIKDGRGDKRVTLSVHAIPVREKRLPPLLMERVKSCISEGRRLLLIVNKKNSSRYLFCPACQRIQDCPHCAAVLGTADDKKVSCRQCDFSASDLTACSRCGKELSEIQDVSISSVKKRLMQEVAVSGVMVVTADDTADMGKTKKDIASHALTIATPVVLNPFFKEMFEAVIYFRPEAVVDMNHHLAGEQLHMLGAELNELVKHGGAVDLFSTFHFHYGLRLIREEEAFFARELKYRQWFRLPPFFSVYQLQVRGRDLRALAKRMRTVLDRFGKRFHIVGARLVSRKKVRGMVRGQMEVHAKPEEIEASGLMKLRDVRIQLQNH